MTISDIEVINLRFVYPANARFAYAGGICTGRVTTLVRVYTDEGISGIGSVYSHPDLVRIIIERHLKELLIGKNPLEIEHLWDLCFRATQWYGRSGCAMSALGGIDIALWDIRGKVAGKPIFRLLGGVSDQIPVYASGLLWKSCSEELEEEAQRHLSRGFVAMKMRLGKNEDYDRAAITTVRKLIGENRRLMVDGNARYTYEQAECLVQLLLDAGVFWFEEPFIPEELAGTAALHRLGVPLAAGENEFGVRGFQQLIESGAVDFVQPDACRTGGITEARRIGLAAGQVGLRVAPHTWSDAVALVANMHVVASLQNAVTVEMDQTGNPFIDDLLSEPLIPSGGMLTIPEVPGLGVELNTETIQRYRIPDNDSVPPGNYSDMVFGAAHYAPAPQYEAAVALRK